ncbi:MAG: adenylosuccinate synthase [Negativicutes bacterium]|nr:adenylosuccinate synthase [Negativicutes bacterium]
MSVRAIVGAQWGDEGKGKIVDLLAQDADVVIRFQGGDNAGHTVVNPYGKFALHLVPCGIFNPKVLNIIGTGTVIDPANLLEELHKLHAAGVATENLIISNRAHLSLPLYSRLDQLLEKARGGNAQGSTLRGIAPVYAAKALRVGLQMGQMLDREQFARSLTELLEQGNHLISSFFGGELLDADAIVQQYLQFAETLKPYIADTLPVIAAALKQQKNILLEGQLGVMRDLDWGIYPYSTSSNPTAGGATSGAGIAPQQITAVTGIVKAFSTAVGAGPFPVELQDATGEYLRNFGEEFGATTGRPRRCGWLDLNALRYAAQLNGFTDIAITKLDTLDQLKTLKVCTAYKINGKIVEGMPLAYELAKAEPVYIEVPGWNCSTQNARSWQDLPVAARDYVELIEAACGVKASWLSVGPSREAAFQR